MQFLYVNSTKLDIVHSSIISGRPMTPTQVVLCNTDHSISEISNHEGGEKKISLRDSLQKCLSNNPQNCPCH